MALILKLGAAPFHQWIINVVEGLSWTLNFLLVSWQKIAPLLIISSFIIIVPPLLYLFMVASAIIGSIGGLSHSSFKKIIAYSSINHLAWLFISFSLPEWILWNYFLIYCLINFTIIFIFETYNVSYINQVIMFFSLKTKFFLFIPLLSLGGLPPLTGFFRKWIIIISAIYKSITLVLILIFSSFISLFYYLQISFSSILSVNYSNKYIIINSRFNLLIILLFLSTFGLPLFILV